MHALKVDCWPYREKVTRSWRDDVHARSGQWVTRGDERTTWNKHRVHRAVSAQQQPAIVDIERSAQFQRLANQWRRETMHVSQVERRIMHPSYQKIIAMGPRVVPLILRELRDRPDHWFWALRILVEEGPIPENFRGSPTDAAHLWLEWGRQVGYL
jgi:hypothetical protein